MRNSILSILFVIAFITLIFSQIDCSRQLSDTSTSKEMRIDRGKYLVNLGLCNNCHSPKIRTANGFIPDTTRLLSGSVTPISSIKFDPKIVTMDGLNVTIGDHTAWIGPWGISYPINLTPDKETGIGNWTEDIFIKSIRTGKHLGEGRPILPPMPWKNIRQLKDEDLKDIFAYLQSLKPIKNSVPDPVTADELTKLIVKKN